MTRLLLLLIVAAIICRMITRRWPWDFLKSGGSSSATKNAQILLGVHPNATRDEIIEAHRRHIARVHPDRGGSSELVHEANDARDLLLRQLTQNKE